MKGKALPSRTRGPMVNVTHIGFSEDIAVMPDVDAHSPIVDAPPLLDDPVPLPDDAPPILGSLELDDFMTEYHPRAQRPPVVEHFEDFRRDHPPVDLRALDPEPWRPFRSLVDFKFAELTLECGLNKSEVTKLLQLIHEIVEDPSKFTFKSHRDIMDTWAVAAHKSPAFLEQELEVPYLDTHRIYNFHYRPLWEWALSLVRDPVLAPLFNWHARRFYKWDGAHWIRFVDEPYTADLWWNIESQLPPDGVPLCFTLYADKTRLSSFGTKKGYPIMARMANLPAEVRNSSGFGGGQIVGLLPIQVEDENEEGKLTFTTLKRVVWHEAFLFLLSTIAKVGKLGELFKCGDGILRLLFPIILILAGDYEEQIVMALNRGPMGLAPCPICLVPQNQQAVLGIEPLWPLRTVEESQQLVEMGGRVVDVDARLRPVGLRPVENTFWKIPYCDPYQALSFDRLHAYHSGLFGKHLFSEFQAIIEENGRPSKIQVNTQFDAVPRWRNLNHFSEVSEISFTDGRKYEDISKVIVPATYNVIADQPETRGYQLFKCIRIYVILDIYASLVVHTIITLQAFKQMLPKFSEEIQKYSEIHPDKNWNFPKAHTHQHAPTDILNKGVTSNYTTKIFESMHVILKDIYLERTNFKNVEGQLAKIYHHFLVARIIRSHLDALEEAKKPDDEDEQEPTSSSSTFEFGHIYLGSRQPSVSFASLEAIPAFNRFHIRLSEYLNNHFLPPSSLPNGRRITLRANDTITIARYLKVNYESMVDWKLETDHLRCSPLFHGTERYDHILYKEDEHVYRFAKLKLILIYKLGDEQYPIAYIEQYDIVEGGCRQVDRDLGLCRIRCHSLPCTSFIPACSIVRGALIMADHAHEGDFFVVDTVDSDMFLRIRRYFPMWDS
ncbi:hypothetical protein BD414DRAFT_456923 [Trametes punicea]|nr:hypothetical protein BD414DRAFT_456923 [Trametes punicea]